MIEIEFKDILDILEIKEEYQIQGALIKVLFSESKNAFLDKFMQLGFDLSNDFIRDIFEQEVANRKSLKQDYTPSCICSLISKLCNKQDEVLDVCSGVGSLSLKINANNNARNFVFEEISDMSISLLLLNLAIRNMSADVYKKDVLTQQIYEHYKLSKGLKYSDIEKVENIEESKKYNCIVSNPPYSLKWDAFNDERFWNYGIAPKSKADYAFILDILYRLGRNGKAYIILPHGVLFRSKEESEIRKALIHDNVIDCIIGLPDKLFMNTDIPTIVMCLKKGKTDKDILFIDASKNFDKSGKKNTLNDLQIEKIIETYRDRKDVEKYSRKISFEEIQENEFNLNIPRYIDNFEKDEPIDIKASIDEIICLEDEIHRTNLGIAKMMGELSGDTEYEITKKQIIDHLTTNYVYEISDALNSIFNFMQNEKCLKKHKEINLIDIVSIERRKKDKIYKKGSILIQLSATRGQMYYLSEDSEVDAKYGVMTAIDQINTKYLYYMIQIRMPKFLNIYQTGLNIVPDVFKHMKIQIHTDIDIQNKIAEMFDNLEIIEKRYLDNIENWKNVKKYHLDNMLV
nr:MAG TPA: N-6 DNA Methylase [Caudoviricetes sp.]